MAILLQDLIPHAVQSARKGGSPLLHVIAATLGVALMMTAQTLTPHEEDDAEIQEGLAVHLLSERSSH